MERPIWNVFGNTFSGVSPIPLQIQHLGNNVVLSWSNPAFSLAASSVVSGGYTKIPGASSPYTNAILASTRFFRLVYP
jgi:hypothetical protein